VAIRTGVVCWVRLGGLARQYLLLATLSLLATHAPAASSQLSTDGNWQGFYSSKPSIYRIKASSEQALNGVLHWSLNAHNRSLVKGDIRIDLEANVATSIPLALKAPELKPDLTLDAALAISLLDGQGHELARMPDRQITLYGSHAVISPFASGQKKLALLDDDAVATEALAAIGLQFDVVSLSNISAQRHDVLLITSVHAFDKTRTLQMLLKLAAGGAHVLLLPREAGEIGQEEVSQIVLNSADTNSASRIELRNSSDKPEPGTLFYWPLAGAISQRIALRPYREAVTAQIEADGHWQWLFVDYDDTGGRFAVSTLPLVQQALENPEARKVLFNAVHFTARQNEPITTPGGRQR